MNEPMKLSCVGGFRSNIGMMGMWFYFTIDFDPASKSSSNLEIQSIYANNHETSKDSGEYVFHDELPEIEFVVLGAS
jgi:hypothetical protein